MNSPDLSPVERSGELTDLFSRYTVELERWEAVYPLAPDRYTLKQLEIIRELVEDVRALQRAFTVHALADDEGNSMRKVALASGVAASTVARWAEETRAGEIPGGGGGVVNHPSPVG